MNLKGLRYGRWLIIEHKNMWVKARCDCGLEKKLTTAPFKGGYNSEMCFLCNKKRMRNLSYSPYYLGHDIKKHDEAILKDSVYDYDVTRSSMDDIHE